ncbi:MAG: Demethylspheroidene O-methyltransferase [Pseudomonadota bacterium]|jgi:demethylspheroidene O-methyltransferase
MNHKLDLADVPSSLQAANTWHDRMLAWLERLYASPRLYSFSLTNPFTRWVTRRRTQKLFDLMAGFVHTQVMLGCIRLDLFKMLHQAPADLQQIAARVNMPAPVLQRLLLSAVSLGLLECRSQSRFGLGPLGVPLATHDGIAAMIEHNHLLYADMQDPVGFLNNAWQGDMAAYWPYAHDAQAATRAAQDKFSRYSDLMAASQGFVVEEILSSYFFDEHQCVLDVGAGKGRFACDMAAHAPHLKVKLFDLPPVLELAKNNVQQRGMSERMSFYPGSFLHDELPQGADLVTLVRVAHDHPDDVVKQLLQKIHAALPLGGVLLLAEPMAQTMSASQSGSAQADAYFHFYLLAMGAGRLRTPEELMRLMAEAGFGQIEHLPNAMPIHAQLIVARKSKCLP